MASLLVVDALLRPSRAAIVAFVVASAVIFGPLPLGAEPDNDGAGAGREDDRALLEADSECHRHHDDVLNEEDRCAMHALQLRGHKLIALRIDSDNASTPAKDDDSDEVVPYFGTCSGKGHQGPSKCAEGSVCQHMNSHYAQCKPESDKTWTKYNGSSALDRPSKAPLLEFYMYRAQGKRNYTIMNVNTGSLGGLMWYLHNEIVSCAYGESCESERRFGISRITRWKVQTRAPQPLFEAGMNFGIRYAFDNGKCSGPWDCNDQWAKYGFFVGCNNFSSKFPYPTQPVFYSGVWYSLPGSCPEQHWEQNVGCREDQPGGLCKGKPTGTGTCTYSYENAGEISLDELEGIDDYAEFVANGGQEYNAKLDAGVKMKFWNGINDTAANTERVRNADATFKQKYPDLPSDEELPPPPCDFDLAQFFPDGLPEE
mmetsp:Transcript_96176/g.242328  ORF Transcript_96176/g.242328 Transcript_96176/m.242328 type:complete len:428 (-) Transcript_96176:397-1680(-)